MFILSLNNRILAVAFKLFLIDFITNFAQLFGIPQNYKTKIYMSWLEIKIVKEILLIFNGILC